VCNDLELGKNFFHLFFMFEYALKANNFTKRDRHRNKVIVGVDWRDFAQNNPDLLNNELEQNERVTPSIEYLLANPPKVQAMDDNGRMEWVDNEIREGTSAEVELCIHICQVRNNLFHGGKFNGYVFDTPERSRTLIHHCTRVLGHVAENHEGIQIALYGTGYNIPDMLMEAAQPNE